MAVQDPTTKSIWCRSSRYTAGGNSRKYIVVHNTANTATAVQEANNLKNNNGSSSFHYAVDDTDIVHCVHDYDTAWAVGAWAGTVQYIGNNQSISIEVCNPGTEFSEASKKNLRALVLHLMDYYGIPADHVVRHWDCHSGRKQCPKFYSGANNAAWNELHTYITTGTLLEDDMTPEQNQMLQSIYNQINRIDTAGHDNPSGHDLYGRVNIIEHNVSVIMAKLGIDDSYRNVTPSSHGPQLSDEIKNFK